MLITGNEEHITLYIIGLLIAVNLLSLIFFYADKRKAELNEFRIPERTLLMSAVFGPFGALLGMLLFRHKIRKNKFRIGVPLLAAAHIVLIVLAFAGG